MWGNILRYAIRAAVAAGLPQKALAWLKGKFEKAADKAENKLSEKFNALVAGKDEVQRLLPDKPSWMRPGKP